MNLGRRSRWGAASVFLLIGATSAEARADDASPADITVRLDYRASTPCPSRDEFLDSVRRYTTKWSLVDDEATRELAIVLDRSEATVRGTLEITVGGRKTRKVVTGPSCPTVTRALAVMVALVIDPGASLSSPREGPPPAPPEPAPTPPARSDEPPTITEQASTSARTPRAQNAGGRTRSTATGRRTTKVRATASAPRWIFEIRHELSSAVTGRTVGLIAGSIDLQVPLFARHDDRTAAIGPSSVGLGLRQSFPREIGVPGGSTEFLWSAGTLRICPLRARLLGDQLDVAPCLEGNLGALQAESHGIPLAQQTRKYWLDGGGSVLGVWHLPGPWVATASLALVAPLTRHRFEVVDLASFSAASGPRSQLVSQAPIIGMTAGLGLGLEL